MIHCPRCDKPIAPGHRCLSRRWFLGLLGASAAAVLVPPAISLPVPLAPAVIPVHHFRQHSAISNKLYRIPFQIYQGGAFAKFNPDGSDLGTASEYSIAWGIA